MHVGISAGLVKVHTVCTEARGQHRADARGQPQVSSSTAFPSPCLRQGLLLKPELTDWLGRLKVRSAHLPHPTVAHSHHCSWPFRKSWGPKPKPYACTGSTLPTDHFPAPGKCILHVHLRSLPRVYEPTNNLTIS